MAEWVRQVTEWCVAHLVQREWADGDHTDCDTR